NVPPPRFSNGYFQLRNRFGMLVETHSWKDYATRVRITRNAIVSVLAQIGQHGADWLKIAREADARAARLGGQDVPLDFAVTEKSRTIEFRGYEYTRTPSDISGTIMVRYEETKPQIWKLPLRDELKATMTATAPAIGYLVPVAYASWLAPKLKQQGIEFRILNSPQRDAAVETFRVEKTKFTSESFENHQALAVEGVWKPEARDLRPGALFVPIAQAKARLVMAILEARAPDSLLAWGEFNIAFELKEYMEDYVAEEVAREQLAGNPGLNAEFQKKLRDDPAFAKSPTARLQFFMRRHPSWDERLNLYPILRTATVPK
ncbi:MAG: peptidase M14, partial [Chthoniobacterales bacterium]